VESARKGCHGPPSEIARTVAITNPSVGYITLLVEHLLFCQEIPDPQPFTNTFPCLHFCPEGFELKCSKCQFENPEGAKFCNDCRQALLLPNFQAPKDLSFDEKLEGKSLCERTGYYSWVAAASFSLAETYFENKKFRESKESYQQGSESFKQVQVFLSQQLHLIFFIFAWRALN
jgi:hypothetical protein